MPFARDTRTQLRQKALADIASRMGGSNPFLRRAVLNVLGLVIADQHADQLGYLDWIARMAVPFTAEGEFLSAWAALRGVTQKAADFAVGSALLTGTPNAPVPIGTILSRGDGMTYAVSLGTVLDGEGRATVSIFAQFAGKLGNADPATPLSVAATPGIDPTATVADPGLTGGADVESFDKLRGRMIEAFANPPQGGSAADYVTWALAVPGVTRAWAAGSQIWGAGTVSVFFMMDDAESAHAGVPQGLNGVSQLEVRAPAATGDQLFVADYIYPRRPVTALVYALAPQPVGLDLVLAEVPVDTAIRSGISDALAAVLLREASPGGSIVPLPARPGTIRRSHIEDAIAAVPGLDHFVLRSPALDVSVYPGQISVPGSIAYL